MKAEKNTKNNISDKKIKLKIIIRFFCTVITLIILILSFISFGWFTMSEYTNINSMNLSAEDDGFEIATKGDSGIYDSYISDVSDGISETFKDEDSNDITLISANGGEIKWRVDSDSHIENYAENNPTDTSKGVQPGSSGKLTFYVTAKKSGTLNVSFSLNTVLYKENEDNSAIVGDEITDPTVTKLVKGHILFFEKYNETGKIYSDRINDSFTFSKTDAVESTAYKVDIYWIWPKVADQLILPSDDHWLTEENKRIVADDTDIIGSNYDNFFYNTNITNPTPNYQDMLDNVKKGSNDSDFSEEYYKSLSDMWNSADQKIGTEVVYIELRLKAQKQTQSQE